MQTKQFNLSEAVSGKTVIDSWGRKGKWIYSLENPTAYYKEYKHVFIFLTEEGNDYLVNSTEAGNAVLTLDFEDYRVLSMQCEEKEYWIATGISTITGRIYRSELLPDENASIRELTQSISLKEGSLQTHKIIRYE